MVCRVAVVGAGIVGVSSAVRILSDLEGVCVTIFAEKTTPDTTGDGAAGFWGPFLDGGTKDEKILEWSKATHDFFEKFWVQGDAPEVGVCLIGVQRLIQEGHPDPVWKDIVYGFRHYGKREVKDIDNTKEFSDGWEYVTYTCECTKMIPHLLKHFYALGGKFVHRKVSDLAELSRNFDVIVNCTGLGSRELVGDSAMHPKRGQLAKVNAPWQKNVFMADTMTGPADRMPYCIPNTYNVGMGGTYQKDDWNTKPTASDRNYIHESLQKFLPGLKHAEVIREWVGLRPSREGGVRLERDEINVGGRVIPVIHNYGHSGSGVTYFWGCAKDVTDHVGDILKDEPKSRRLISKL